MLSKNEEQWPICCHLEKKITEVGPWQTESWQWLGIHLLESTSSIGNQKHSETSATKIQNHQLLELFKDERMDYRFNLSSEQPKLFLALDSQAMTDSDSPHIACLTASQNVIACFMDTDYDVQAIDMPLVIQAWMEAFIGRHGELVEIKKKKREGAGRSSGQ